MDKSDINIHPGERVSSWGYAILLLGLALAGSLLGSFIGLIIALPLYDGSLLDIQETLASPEQNPSLKTILFISQGVATVLGMILVPAFYLKITLNKSIGIFFKELPGWIPLVSCILVVFSFMVVNSAFIEWNATVEFPEFMEGFERWAREKEDSAAEMTKYLTDFQTNTDIILAVIVIAILAPMGEELLFRGFLQNQFHHASSNIHVAIWLSAILFSAIHIQFFGFVPRLLLGGLFGYLYYWSGNLWIPILGHLVNNGFTLLMVYMHQKELTDYDLENTEAVPLSAVLIFAIITAGLLYFFRNYFKHRSADEGVANDI